MSDTLPRAHGGALGGTLRSLPEDFVVEELLGFEPSGTGEHAFLLVEKRGANTAWLARELARHAGVAPVDVGFAGLKDRHALTRQAFTVRLAGRADPDWNALATEGCRVLSATRHARKLPRGALRGNRFTIRVRDVRNDDDVDALLAAIATRGVPNYFGVQRFGRDGGNLAQARAMFAGRRVAREARGFLLSAARSEVFNALLASRVADGSWERALDGDVFQIDGSGSVFGPEPLDDELHARVARGAIHPTGPMWGEGALRSGGAAAALELATAEAHADFVRGLERAGLRQERRALRVVPRALAATRENGDLVLAFELPAGAFATTVLAELGAFDGASTSPDPGE